MKHSVQLGHTVFDTPIIKNVAHRIGVMGLKLLGWRMEGPAPVNLDKFIVTLAPHTSNWDFILLLFVALALRVKSYWMVKSIFFWGPLGPVSGWLGGIPINRKRAHDVVPQCIQHLRASDRMVITITIEGTRKRVKYWKAGFYHIAQGADVPIVTISMDYENKIITFGPVIKPTGDIHADMAPAVDFYAAAKAKYPECTSPMKFHGKST